MKNKLLLLLVILSVLGGCKKDNKEPPKSTLTGRVVMGGSKTPVGVASNGTQLEIWQSGYALYNKIPVYIDQDGTFSAKLFDGSYKLVRLSGAPWANNTDTIRFDLKGSTEVEVSVAPYFTPGGETFTYSAADTSITASFTVARLDATKTAEKLSFHIGLTNIVDAQGQQIPIPAASNDKNPAVDYLTAPTVIKLMLNPDRYTGTANTELRRQLLVALTKKYAFVRVGVKTTGVVQRMYTQVKEVALK